MGLRRVAYNHFSQACKIHLQHTTPTAHGLATSSSRRFLTIHKPQEVYQRGRRCLSMYWYIWKHFNFLLILFTLLGLNTYPLIHIFFLLFYTCCSTLSHPFQILHLWWLVSFCFSRSFYPKQFSVFSSLCSPQTYSRQTCLSSSPEPSSRVSWTLFRREQWKNINSFPLKT